MKDSFIDYIFLIILIKVKGEFLPQKENLIFYPNAI